jgi:vacuolar-type H+-ATPase subunit E/Vma4
MFVGTIMQDANARCAEIRNETDKRRDEFMKEAEAELLAEMYDLVRTKTAEARAEAGRRISRKIFENKRALYDCLTGIKEDILGKVRARILAYVGTPGYLSDLKKMAARAAGFLGCDDLVIRLRPEDMKHVEALKAEVPAVYTEGDFELGGLVAESALRKLRVDLSYDASLSEISQRFGEITGLRPISG